MPGCRRDRPASVGDLDPEVAWSVVEQEPPEPAAAAERMVRASEG